MRLAVLLLLVPLTATADDKPPTTPTTIELIDRGEAVEVIARNVKAARTAISPVRSRLEVPVIGMPRLGAGSPSDATVKVIELAGGENRVLSVKLNFGREDVKSLARFSQAIQVGDDLHLMIPRTLPPEGTGVVLPEPTLPPELAAKIAAKQQDPARAAGPTPPPAPAPAPAAQATPAPAPVPAGPAPAPKTDAAPATTAPAPAEPAEAKPAAKKPDPWAKLTSYAAIGLALAGAGMWLMRRKRAQQSQTSSIDIIAQRSLGAKAKIVWFTAGNREMVVAVTPQAVRMLGQWKKNEPAAALPEAHTVDKLSSSPAVAGILKLRGKTVPPPDMIDEVEASNRIRRYSTQQGLEALASAPLVNEDVATGDLEADAAWAKEILAATGRARSRR